MSYQGLPFWDLTRRSEPQDFLTDLDSFRSVVGGSRLQPDLGLIAEWVLTFEDAASYSFGKEGLRDVFCPKVEDSSLSC